MEIIRNSKYVEYYSVYTKKNFAYPSWMSTNNILISVELFLFHTAFVNTKQYLRKIQYKQNDLWLKDI